MFKSLLSLSLIGALTACGASFPPPTHQMSEAKAAVRSAEELGAKDEPQAQLSLKLAQEQIAMAEKAIADGENKQAQSLLIRAKADGELALAKAREKSAKIEGQKAVDASADQKTTNAGQGAVK